MLLLIRIQDFIDRKLLISDTAEIPQKYPVGLEIASLRVLCSPVSLENNVLHTHWIFLFFMLYNHNDSCVFGQFVFSLDNSVRKFRHSWVKGIIQFPALVVRVHMMLYHFQSLS